MALISPRDAWAVRRQLVGHEPDGDLPGVSAPVRPLLDYLGSLASAERRAIAWEGYLSGRADRDELVRAVAESDPSAPPPGPQPHPEPEPEAEPAFRFATLADVRRVQVQARWLWEGWIPAARIAGLAAFEGTGKTREALDLARRIYHGLDWPDGQRPTLPAGTRTVWICSDAHQDELVEILSGLDLPDEAVVFPTSSADPYGGTDLDRPETLADLSRCIAEVRPGLVFVDTLTSATSVDLSDQRSVKPLRAKLAPLVQAHGVTIVLLLHLSREGQALGRRIKGLTRTLMHLECPDPEAPHRLRMWVEKSYARKPPPLGVTMTDRGNEYDFQPPGPPERNPVGRPSTERERACRYIRDALAGEAGVKATGLCEAFVGAGGTRSTFWSARDALVASGEILCEGRPLMFHRARHAPADGPPPGLQESRNPGVPGFLESDAARRPEVSRR